MKNEYGFDSDIKKEFPETPQFIKDMIKDEVSKQVNKKNTGAEILKKCACIAGICISSAAIVGGTAYAATKAGWFNVGRNGDYAINVDVATDASMQENTDINNTQGQEKASDSTGNITIPQVALELKYIPDGYMTIGYAEENGTKKSTASKILIAPESQNYSLPNASIYVYSLTQGYENFKITDDNITLTEELEISENPAFYTEFSTAGASAGQYCSSRIYILYPKLNHVVEVWGWNDIEKSQLMKIAENIKLTEALENEEMYRLDYVPEYEADHVYYQSSDDEITAYKQFVDRYSTVTASAFEKNLHKKGEEVRFDGDKWALSGVNKDGSMGVRIAGVGVYDNVDAVTPTKYCSDIADYIGTDGRLIDEELQTVKRGDGVNTVDSVISTEYAPMKFVLVTYEYTNYSNEAIEDYCFEPGTLVRVRKENDAYVMYTNNTPEIQDNGVEIVGRYYSDGGNADYWLGSAANSNNHLFNIKPGETVTAYAGYFVKEQDLPYMYLSLEGYEDNQAFGYRYVTNGDVGESNALKTGYFDIRVTR